MSPLPPLTERQIIVLNLMRQGGNLEESMGRWVVRVPNGYRRVHAHTAKSLIMRGLVKASWTEDRVTVYRLAKGSDQETSVTPSGRTP